MLIPALKDRILSRLKEDLNSIRGDYKIDKLWDRNVQAEDVQGEDNRRLKSTNEVLLTLLSEESLETEVLENLAKLRIVSNDLNKHLKVCTCSLI